ncbi:sigma-70 family RNA polymerase sigma factor [Actinomadura kijaniata]|uniref:RNA polymerase sigma-70 factor (ECF subfamily) n=1 Tax=Actinomadura namibiensis TaxID=182080 RepID=A0A7W3LMD1_ACTNM|nr:sigma-70 family RNA polymerase sigma factor [Actinomadura namibiensis]MBA8950810.1 RNA polymerase sigma-70 factor (ECF subfamily) [Actinomadura namibiensis]
MDADVERFTAIYRKHYPKVLSYALAHDARAVAEDVANETFLTAWRKLDQVPDDDPLPWLFGVARRHRLKQRDAGRRHATIAERARRMRSEHGADAGEVVAEREAGLAAFAALPERDAEALVLSAWYGFSAGQAARVLGCSTATYFVRLHRARKRLARLLSTSDHASFPHPALEGQRG